MKFYFPESKSDGGINYIGYNNAVTLFRKALLDYMVDYPDRADYRVYCNLPWHDNIKKFNKEKLPLLVYTMYESTCLPLTWVNFLNKHASIVLVPTKYVKNIFETSGVRRPIYVLSLCVDFKKIPHCPKENKKKPYTFLWQGVAYDNDGRKGVDVVTQAFKELMADGLIASDTRLILKYLPYRDINFVIEDLPIYKGVFVLQKKLTFEEMNSLYREVDCCVNPTHCEGFGLIPLEQMARGKPVILTNYSMPYLDEKYNYPVSYTLKPSPVTWNHLHLKISKNGIVYNFGGLCHEIKLLPRVLKTLSVNKSFEIKPNGFMPVKNTFIGEITAQLNNFARKIQLKTRLHYQGDAKCYDIFQEFQGFDAHVNIKDLKRLMLYCYNNRENAEKKGREAREYVRRNWDLDRMRSDFKKFKLYI